MEYVKRKKDTDLIRGGLSLTLGGSNRSYKFSHPPSPTPHKHTLSVSLLITIIALTGFVVSGFPKIIIITVGASCAQD